MDHQDQHTIETAQESINQLLEACRKNGPLYRQHPREVAQVNRNARWLLSALAGLQNALYSSVSDSSEQES